MNNKIKLVSTPDGKSGYLYLPNHPGEGMVGCAAKQIRLMDLLAGSVNFEIHIDLDENGNPIGIEIDGE